MIHETDRSTQTRFSSRRRTSGRIRGCEEFRSGRFVRAAILLLGVLTSAFGCSSYGDTTTTASSLDRPTAIVIAKLEHEPTSSEIKLYDYYLRYAEDDEVLFEECLTFDYRAFAFIANSGGNSVAKLDLCKREVIDTHAAGNPFVVSHIPVGQFPLDLAVSRDERQSRVFVSLGGEDALSVLDTYAGLALALPVTLPGRPGALTVVPSETTPEGRVAVLLPERGEVAFVDKVQGSDVERWQVSETVSLATTATPDPLPNGLVLSPDGKTLFVTDLNSEYFYMLDMAQPTLPPRVRSVQGPQQSVSVSPDGRYLYFAKFEKSRVAVYDLVQDAYVDTNEELPSHRNHPPASNTFDYDIAVQNLPELLVFTEVKKVFPDLSGGDEDAESVEEEIETDGDTELEEIEVEEEAEDDPNTGIGGTDVIPSSVAPGLFAYVIGQRGLVQVVDVHDDMHELFDTRPSTPPSMQIVSEDELEKDNGQCLADLDVRVYRNRTPDALWELQYNGIVPLSGESNSGVIDAEKNRFYDATRNFANVSALQARNDHFNGDHIVITTSPIAAAGEHQGCTQEYLNENGEPAVRILQRVKLEITGITPDYLEFDSNGIDLEECFMTAVSYEIRSNDNYVVYMTELDRNAVRIGERMYQGRAGNSEFMPSDVIHGEDELDQLSFERDDWLDYLCIMSLDDGEGGEIQEYRFRTTLNLNGSDDSRQGIRCRNPWEDDDSYGTSFSNDFLDFSICQDIDSSSIQAKRQETFKYSFRTTSGINQIRVGGLDDDEYDADDEYDSVVGSIPVDAALLDFYENHPRLYIVDQAEERLYIVELDTDNLLVLTL